jgi:hypothetical protein
MKFNNTEVFNFDGALRGMRNPLESGGKSDSKYTTGGMYIIGENDMNLAQRLIRAGGEHRKFMRQIFVSVDITAPLYWWKEFDTYKVGTTANSTSTMHKLATTPITLDCFEIGDYESELNIEELYGSELNTIKDFVNNLIEDLEFLRVKYYHTGDKRYWKELIRWLPESWLQTRTVTLTYENLISIYHHRKGHKLTEWSVDFINWCHTLPYSAELLFIGGDN